MIFVTTIVEVFLDKVNILTTLVVKSGSMVVENRFITRHELTVEEDSLGKFQS